MGRRGEGLLGFCHDNVKRVGKSTYATWLKFFNKGEDSRSGYMVEAVLAYWLSYFILSSGPEDGLDSCVFFPNTLLSKAERLALDYT